MERLLQLGANVNYRTSDKNTPLRAACYTGSIKIVQCLLQSNANVDYADELGQTPLLVSCYSGRTTIVEILLQHGANAKATLTRSGRPLRQVLQSRTRPEIARLMVQNGASVHRVVQKGNILDDDSGNSFLHGVRFSGTAQIYLENGVSVEARNHLGETPLFWVCDVSVARFLVQNGANVNAKNKIGDTPLHRIPFLPFQHATKNKSMTVPLVVSFLLDQGSNSFVKNDAGQTPRATAPGYLTPTFAGYDLDRYNTVRSFFQDPCVRLYQLGSGTNHGDCHGVIFETIGKYIGVPVAKDKLRDLRAIVGNRTLGIVWVLL